MAHSSVVDVAALLSGRRLLVLIPAHNEESAVSGVLADVAAHLNCDVVVIDDHSSDGTAETALRCGAMVMPLVYQLGAWGATQTGLRYALQASYDYVVSMDADGQHLARTVPELLRLVVEARADVAIGAFPERGSFLRHVAWRLFRGLTGLALEDLTSGLRVYNRKAVAVLTSHQATLLEYQDIGVLLLLRAAGLRIAELPVTMERRTAGISRVFSTWLAVFYYMFYSGVLAMSKRSFGLRSKARSRPGGRT